MPKLNEIKYQALSQSAGFDDKMNSLEHLYLDVLGAAPGTNLGSRWYDVFSFPGPWNDAAHQWLDVKGIAPGKLNARWYEYWYGIVVGGADLTARDAVAQYWTPRALNTITDSGGSVILTNVDNDGGCYLRLSTLTILSRPLLNGFDYRITFNINQAVTGYIGLALPAIGYNFTAGENVIDFQPENSTDPFGATFLNINLPGGPGDARTVLHNVQVEPVPLVGAQYPDMILVAGDSGGSRAGYIEGSYGSITPDHTSKGDLMTALFVNNSNGRVRFKVQGEYPPDAFYAMRIVGVGTLLASQATYDFDGIETEYRWDSTVLSLVSGTTYAVEWV